MDENLVGYLLGALDPDARGAVEAHLKAHPAARARLDLLGRALRPLAADAEPAAPPPGLALAALARVAEHQCRRLPAAPPPPPQHRVAPPRRWARRADLLVAAALVLVLAGLGTSALAQWRAYQQRIACANNLRELWGGFARFGAQRDDPFPPEDRGPRSFAGVFIPLLKDAGTLGPQVTVGCPAQGRREAGPQTVRELDKLYRTNRGEFRAAVRDLAGDYAFPLGYEEGGRHHGLRTSDDRLPLLADRPPAGGRGNSPNHGGGGQNVLYIGGQVRWCTHCRVGLGGDDIYVNQEGQVRAGRNRGDTVLAPGDATPSGDLD